MKKVVNLLTVLFVIGISVHSQSKEGLLTIPQAKVEDSGNAAFIMQIGVDNDASVYQNGQNNEALVTQLGNSHTTTVTQNGNNNSANSILVGYGQNENINQQGDNNTKSTIKFGNANPNANSMFMQRGNGHSVTYVQYEGAPGVKVEQKGNAGTVLIKQGRIGSF